MVPDVKSLIIILYAAAHRVIQETHSFAANLYRKHLQFNRALKILVYLRLVDHILNAKCLGQVLHVHAYQISKEYLQIVDLNVSVMVNVQVI